MTDPAALRRFILANTRLQAPPHVPEVRLNLADEAFDLWRMTEAELDASGLPPPFWAFAWAGGQALARHVLDTPALVRGRSVLSFAAGSGLEAIAAMTAGADRVLASDIDPYAQAAIALNAETNGVAVTVTGTDLLGGPVPKAEVILLGDVFYERPLAEAVLAFGRAAHRAGRTVLIGDPGRAYLPRSGLDAIACYTVPTTRALEDSEVKQTTVWRIAE